MLFRSYHPIFPHTFPKFDDFALVVPHIFIEDPVQSLDDAVEALTRSQLEEKIEGLRLMQRILACDKTDSLFVSALAKEIVAGMHG